MVDSGLVSLIANQNERKKQEQDPFNIIMKGLSVANQVYGIKQAGEQAEALKQQNANRQKNQEFSNKVDLASKGLKLDENGNVVEDTTSSFYQQRIRKGEVDPTTAAIRGLQLENAKSKRDELAKGSKLPASQAIDIGGANASFQALEEAKKTFEANQDISGPGQGLLSRAKGAFELGDTGKRAKTFDAQTLANAQIIGKYLEGGKLTDADIDRYKSMLPNINDSSVAAANKATILQNLIAQKQSAEKQALQQAGYNVQQLETSKIQDNPNLTKKQSSPQNKAAEILIKRKGLGAAAGK